MNDFIIIHPNILVTMSSLIKITPTMEDIEIIALFEDKIPDFISSNRYVAVNEITNDCVIYENGNIIRVSDSG
jgi:hypothetical protein